MKILRAVLLSALALTGCASAGTNFDQATANAIQPGATKAEVVAHLGPPNVVSARPDGGQVLIWSHAQVNGWTGSTQARAVSFLFDANGRMVRQGAQSQMEGRSSH